MSDARAGQLSPQQARRLWQLHRDQEHDALRKELAAMSPGWADLTQREQRKERG